MQGVVESSQKVSEKTHQFLAELIDEFAESYPINLANLGIRNNN